MSNMFGPDWSKAPKDHLGAALVLFHFKGIRPGHALSYMLKNDLAGFFHAADEFTLREAQMIFKFIWDEMPASAWGSVDKFDGWCLLRHEEPLDEQAMNEALLVVAPDKLKQRWQMVLEYDGLPDTQLEEVIWGVLGVPQNANSTRVPSTVMIWYFEQQEAAEEAMGRATKLEEELSINFAVSCAELQ